MLVGFVSILLEGPEVGDVKGSGLLLMASALGALACMFTPQEARASCSPPGCCFEGALDLKRSLTIAEVTAVRPGAVSLRLLQASVYCDDGLPCEPADFPAEATWGTESCPEECAWCEALSVGDQGLFFVVSPDGCLLGFRPLTAEGVQCESPALVEVEFALVHGLRPTCIQDYVEAGLWDCHDSFSEFSMCSHAGLGGGLALGLVTGLRWLASALRKGMQ